MAWLSGALDNPTSIETALSERVAGQVSRGVISEPEIRYIQTLPLRAIEQTLHVDDIRLTRLRGLCSLFDVDLKPLRISSHRPVLGKIIVALKRLLFPILKAFLEPTLRQQRMFNAQVLAHLIDLTRSEQPK